MNSMLTTALLAAIALQQPRIVVDATKPTLAVSPSLYGIFFEEINQGGEGGILAEMLRNRGFDSDRVGWTFHSEGGEAGYDAAERLSEARPRSLKLSWSGSREGVSAVNQGFWGIPLTKGTEYRLVLWLKGDAPVNAMLLGGKDVLASSNLTPGAEWTRREWRFRPSRSDPRASLALRLASNGTTWIGYSSLAPAKAEPFRRDLHGLLKTMSPGFVRFPGGCFVEGDTLPYRWKWKDSLGPIEQRKGMPFSLWGYPVSNGLGFHEYLQLCEDLGAEPLFVINVGMSHREVQPLGAMDSYVQDALDAIEYANGPVSSKWGSLRAKSGHPKPFHLKYIEIGNENGGPAYNERFPLFSNAIHQRYPEIVRIADLWNGTPTSAPFELIDEHYYSSPAWFWRNKDRYDSYNRTGPKVYVGEYAVTQGSGRGNLAGALAEAAFMTGLERNSDVVRLASYAPLFENVNNRQWSPNAILFDSSRSYGTPSYWVQALFAQNRADRILSHSVVAPAGELPPMGGSVGLMTWRTDAEFKDIQLTVDGKAVDVPLKLEESSGNWTVENGVVHQSVVQDNRRTLLAGLDTSGSRRAVLSLKARKLRGDEGFIIIFEQSPGRRLQWNLGGWENTVHAFQLDDARFGKGVPAKIDTDRWYDIRIEQERDTVRGYLDGKLVEEVKIDASPDFAAVAGLDKGKNQVILKVVNGATVSRTVSLELDGIARNAPAQVITLKGASLTDENSFEAPRKVAPITTYTTVSPHQTYTFPPLSLTILRIRRGAR